MAKQGAHILIVEDEPVTRETLADYLQTHGYRVTPTGSAKEAEAVLEAEPVELMLVDITLEGKDGLQITREQRARSDIGIILITGHSDDVDRIVGLELGADDYVCKPFNRRELLARIRNILRRIAAAGHPRRAMRQFGPFRFDLVSRQLTHEERGPIRLTRAEFQLLASLVEHPGEVMSRERLMRAITHRQETPDTRTIDVIVRRLRAKLEPDPRNPELITTSHGEGYVFTARPE